MAGRKKEGLDGLKVETGGKRRDDRNKIDKSTYPVFNFDAKEVNTVILLLKSPENNVKLRALASLDTFLKKDVENQKFLCSLGIVECLVPLTEHEDGLIRRFSLKLLGVLSSTEEFQEEMLAVDGMVEKLLNILKKESDVVLQEYSSLALSNLTKDYAVASDLLKIEKCADVVLQRLSSNDPDVLKNCLTIMSQLLNDINGIDMFIESTNFDMMLLINTIYSSYDVIQNLVLQVLIQLTSWCKDTRILFLFRDARGLETVLEVLENQEWRDLYSISLDLIINIMDNPDMCYYFYQSGGLARFICFLNDPYDEESKAKILGVLARLSQTKKGQEALHLVEMESKFVENLEGKEIFQEPACLGIVNLSQYFLSLEKIIEAKAVKELLGIILNSEKSTELRNLAAHALNILCNASYKAVKDLMEDESYQGLFAILTDNSNLSLELCKSVMQTFIGISPYHDLRIKLVSENFLSALMSCLPIDTFDAKDPCIQVDALECLSEFMVESDFRSLFLQSEGVKILINCLRSKFASVREWAGHLVGVASQNKDFVLNFIEEDGLDWMLKEKNTMYSMPSWQSAIETIFSNYLPAKFAYTGRLNFHDVTQDGFFISTNPKLKFVVIDVFHKKLICPLAPIYVANFGTPNGTQKLSTASQISVQETMEPQSSGSITSSKQKSQTSTPKCKLSCDQISQISEGLLEDPVLNEHLENLKQRITKEELPFGDMSWTCIHPRLICNRARIIAELIAEEMAAPDPNSPCNGHYNLTHIKDLMCYLGTNIFPLGLIRIGDYLERAMLFKVLADRIGFPCAFVRGSYGRAWIEIAVPVINVESSEEESLRGKSNSFTLPISHNSSNVTYSYQHITEKSPSEVTLASVSQSQGVAAEEDFWFPKIQFESFKGLPRNFLKPNVIVDLVREPGRLLNINSPEAEEYCGAFLF